MKQIIKIGTILFCTGVLAGCTKYLDVVPDGIATIDNAFSSRVNAERFFFGCYNMLPNQNDPFKYPGNVGADDIWYNPLGLSSRSGARIARNDQNGTDPFQNYWDGRRDGYPAKDGQGLYVGIRDCNIFIDNIDRVPDLEDWERIRWIAEVKFIKAYLHYFLLQLYGPIPIVDVNLPVNASPEEVRVYRAPVEEVIEYVLTLIDEAMLDLPLEIDEPTTQMGRVTQVIAASLKAKVLVWAASPLLNGNPDYADMIDNRGVKLIPTEYKKEKWERALEAIDTAIEMCHNNGRRLFDFNPGMFILNDTVNMKFTHRGVVSEKLVEGGNTEVIWAHPALNNHNQFQAFCIPKINATWGQKDALQGLGATLKMAEQYYTRNGVPIDEDTAWNYGERYLTSKNTDPFHRLHIRMNETTANLNYYREIRFYSHLSFDRGYFEMLATPEETAWMINGLSGQQNGYQFTSGWQPTGYFIKKLVSPRTAVSGSDPSYHRFSIPLIRLGDLYLLRAEAANELQDAPDHQGVWQWIDAIRDRAGFPDGVVKDWADHSMDPQKPLRKDGMREIIKRERLIELAFEGQRSFDLRRWKEGIKYENQPVQGWTYNSTDPEDYYRVATILANRNFTTKDYLWPIYQATLDKNPNLVPNPGW